MNPQRQKGNLGCEGTKWKHEKPASSNPARAVHSLRFAKGNGVGVV